MADPICRWRNPYVKTIVELVKILPKEVMPSEQFREIVEKRWPGFLRTAYQLACQTGLYYESDDDVYYPRFDHDINEEVANVYMQKWIRRYYVPNPYTKSMKSLQQPQPFLASIIGYIYEHPNEVDLHSILESVFQEDIGNIDIISNVLNTYTDLMKVDSTGNVELTANAKDFMKKFVDRNDKKAFFENFSDEVTETTQEELLRHSSAATFLRKALKIVDTEDPNLSKLEALGKYKETNKQLKINGFNLWRKKDELPLRLDDVYQDLEILYNNQMYVMYLEWTPADMETLFFPVFNSAYNSQFSMCKEGNEYVLYKINLSRKGDKVAGPLQQIFYGAPGTGKSDTIYEKTKDLPKEDVYRTTFHPDSDYASFVGSYKPKMNDRTIYGAQGPLRNSKGEEISEPKITYTFCSQAFTNAYIRAWQTNEPVFLIIEEINRGNCAQIFGDLFQLLDRDENGYSKYEIVADSDLADCIKEKLDHAGEKECLTSDIKEGRILKLPNNLYIWATMNTSDQSLFPIDSAFKRRWEWKYIKIKKGINKKTKQELDWKIKVGEENYDWWEFVNRINDKIAKMTSSADKQLGYFFCLADGKGEINVDTFVNKVAFYLWNDVFKDYAEDGSPLLKYKKKEDDKSESDLTFPDFFDQSGEIDKNVVKQFVEKVMKEDEMDKPVE